MPRGPKGEKRPADVVGNAIHVMKIATGQIEDITTEDGRNAAAVALGRMGGKARAERQAAEGDRKEGHRETVVKGLKIVSSIGRMTLWAVR
jgi:hypothetical protein